MTFLTWRTLLKAVAMKGKKGQGRTTDEARLDLKRKELTN